MAPSKASSKPPSKPPSKVDAAKVIAAFRQRSAELRRDYQDLRDPYYEGSADSFDEAIAIVEGMINGKG